MLQTVLMLGVIWWMYSGYAWLTNAVSPDRPGRRLLLLAGMASYLALALAVLFSRTTPQRVVRAVFEIAPFNLFSAALVLVGGIVGGIAEYVSGRQRLCANG